MSLSQRIKLIQPKIIHIVLAIVSFAIFLLLPPHLRTFAQSEGIIWERPVNISRSEESTSVDSTIYSDPTGRVHLFWAERTSSQPGNVPDTLMYTVWDGENWADPIDLYFAPVEHGNQKVSSPLAVLDANNNFHLVWLSQPNFPNYALFYSTAPASSAGSVTAWSTPIIIGDDLTGTEKSIDIKIDEFQNIHIVYARVPQGDNPPELRAVTYIKSTDLGKTWSKPVDLYTIPETSSGASHTRLLLDNDGQIFLSWTEWDLSGNGQAIFFTRSFDYGETWDTPIVLAQRSGNEYERDWNNMAFLGKDTIVAVWEGGWRAYRHAMYSYDAGETWTEPVDIFPGLIGENGYAEFVTDSAGTLHLFVAQRTREGNTIQESDGGLYHSIWEGGTIWKNPELCNGVMPMLNPKVVVVNGNQIVVTWYTDPDFEIMTMVGTIQNAPYIEPVVEISSPTPASTPTSFAIYTLPKTTETPELPVNFISSSSPSNSANPGLGSLIAIFSTGAIIIIVVVVRKLLQLTSAR